MSTTKKLTKTHEEKLQTSATDLLKKLVKAGVQNKIIAVSQKYDQFGNPTTFNTTERVKHNIAKNHAEVDTTRTPSGDIVNSDHYHQKVTITTLNVTGVHSELAYYLADRLFEDVHEFEKVVSRTVMTSVIDCFRMDFQGHSSVAISHLSLTGKDLKALQVCTLSLESQYHSLAAQRTEILATPKKDTTQGKQDLKNLSTQMENLCKHAADQLIVKFQELKSELRQQVERFIGNLFSANASDEHVLSTLKTTINSSDVYRSHAYLNIPRFADYLSQYIKTSQILLTKCRSCLDMYTTTKSFITYCEEAYAEVEVGSGSMTVPELLKQAFDIKIIQGLHLALDTSVTQKLPVALRASAKKEYPIYVEVKDDLGNVRRVLKINTVTGLPENESVTEYVYPAFNEISSHLSSASVRHEYLDDYNRHYATNAAAAICELIYSAPINFSVSNDFDIKGLLKKSGRVTAEPKTAIDKFRASVTNKLKDEEKKAEVLNSLRSMYPNVPAFTTANALQARVRVFLVREKDWDVVKGSGLTTSEYNSNMKFVYGNLPFLTAAECTPQEDGFVSKEATIKFIARSLAFSQKGKISAPQVLSLVERLVAVFYPTIESRPDWLRIPDFTQSFQQNIMNANSPQLYANGSSFQFQAAPVAQKPVLGFTAAQAPQMPQMPQVTQQQYQQVAPPMPMQSQQQYQQVAPQMQLDSF